MNADAATQGRSPAIIPLGLPGELGSRSRTSVGESHPQIRGDHVHRSVFDPLAMRVERDFAAGMSHVSESQAWNFLDRNLPGCVDCLAFVRCRERLLMQGQGRADCVIPCSIPISI